MTYMILYPKMKILSSVESIQDMVENKLMEYNEYETAKKIYIV